MSPLTNRNMVYPCKLVIDIDLVASIYLDMCNLTKGGGAISSNEWSSFSPGVRVLAYEVGAFMG